MGRHYRVDPDSIPEAVVEGGFEVEMTYCPRCGQLLSEEPALYYCKWGCTRVFQKNGARLRDQIEFERKSGLRVRELTESKVNGSTLS